MKSEQITAERPVKDEGRFLPGGQRPVPTVVKGQEEKASKWTQFWFTPVDPWNLHLLRVGAGLLFFFWLASLAGHQVDFFSLNGWFDRQAYFEANRLEGGPPAPIGWSLTYLCGTNTDLLNYLYWGSLGVIFLFTLGLAPRITGILTWIAVVSFLANPATSYDADYLLVILAFYLMIGYVLAGQWSRTLTWPQRLFGPADYLLLGRKDADPSYAANLVQRLVQVHIAFIIVASAFHKLQMGVWWSGYAFWFPLHPPFETTLASLSREQKYLDLYLTFLTLAQYAALAWAFGFPFFAWRQTRWCRFLLLGGAGIGWLGSFFVFRQPLFGPIFFLGCLSYLTTEEWSWWRGKLQRAAAA